MTDQPDIQLTLARITQALSQQTFPVSALYVIATPIGNTGDISLRALHVLTLANAIACEDTRTTGSLLGTYGLSKKMIPAHQHNEREAAEKIIQRLRNGERVALVSDAGTPGISDPGTRIVEAVRSENLRVIPIPGASAAITALSVSGLMNDHFHFIGFLPSKTTQRDLVLKSLHNMAATMVIYEAPHRISETIDALERAFEPTRQLIIARELTKLFEEVHQCNLADASAWLKSDANHTKGEFVLLLQGAEKTPDEQNTEAERILSILLSECSTSQAAALTARITGVKKNHLYQRALELKNEA